MWKTASASPPPGGRPRLVADHTHKEPCTKIARAGACSFLPISQLTVEEHLEVSVFRIYLFCDRTPSAPVACPVFGPRKNGLLAGVKGF